MVSASSLLVFTFTFYVCVDATVYVGWARERVNCFRESSLGLTLTAATRALPSHYTMTTMSSRRRVLRRFLVFTFVADFTVLDCVGFSSSHSSEADFSVGVNVVASRLHIRRGLHGIGLRRFSSSHSHSTSASMLQCTWVWQGSE